MSENTNAGCLRGDINKVKKDVNIISAIGNVNWV